MGMNCKRRASRRGLGVRARRGIAAGGRALFADVAAAAAGGGRGIAAADDSGGHPSHRLR